MAILASKTKTESAIKPGIFEGADRKMVAVLSAKLDRSLVQTVMLEGKRYDAGNAKRYAVLSGPWRR